MGSQRDEEAWRIASDMIELTRSSLIDGEFDRYADAFTYPHIIVTSEKTIEIKDREDMRRLYDNLRASYERIGLTHLARQCLAAEFRSDGTLRTAHINHMMSGTRRLNEPIPVYAILKKVGETWRITKAEYATDKRQPFGAALEVGQKTQPLR